MRSELTISANVAAAGISYGHVRQRVDSENLFRDVVILSQPPSGPVFAPGAGAWGSLSAAAGRDGN
jgi:hypothetical protein